MSPFTARLLKSLREPIGALILAAMGGFIWWVVSFEWAVFAMLLAIYGKTCLASDPEG